MGLEAKDVPVEGQGRLELGNGNTYMSNTGAVRH
jgi:hypothetical protein